MSAKTGRPRISFYFSEKSSNSLTEKFNYFSVPPCDRILKILYLPASCNKNYLATKCVAHLWPEDQLTTQSRSSNQIALRFNLQGTAYFPDCLKNLARPEAKYFGPPSRVSVSFQCSQTALKISVLFPDFSNL